MSVVQVAAGLIERDGRFLIARRKHGAHLAGFWEFPGGKQEVDETLEACLRRELKEELAVEITTPVHFHTTEHPYRDKTVALHFFLCAIESGEPRPLDCEELRWVTPDEMAGYEFPPADRPVVEALRKRALNV